MRTSLPTLRFSSFFGWVVSENTVFCAWKVAMLATAYRTLAAAFEWLVSAQLHGVIVIGSATPF